MRVGKRTLILLILIFFTLTCSYGASNKDNTKKVIDVAVVFRLNDKYNKTVGDLVKGINAAKTLYQQEHPNITIRLHKYSHNGDLESVLATANRVIHDKIPAVIGGELSSEALVLSEKFGEHKIIFITPTSSNPAVTQKSTYSFRGCFSDTYVADRLAKFTIEELKPSAIGVIHDVSSPYPNYLTARFIDTFKKTMAIRDSNDRIPLYEENIIMNTSGFDQQIKTFIKNKVTHVVFLDYQVDLLGFEVQAAKQGYFPIYLGSDGWGSNESIFKNLIQVNQQDKNFVGYRNSYWNQAFNTKIAQQFRDTFTKQNSCQPNAWNAIAFDTAWVLFTGMTNASNQKDPDAVKKRLEQINNLSLVTTEKFIFDSDHSPRNDLYIYKIDRSGIKNQAVLK